MLDAISRRTYNVTLPGRLGVLVRMHPEAVPARVTTGVTLPMRVDDYLTLSKIAALAARR
jgi:hypothetical protein